MKKIFILFTLLFTVVTNAQEFKETKNKAFNIEDATDTKTTITIDSKQFNIFETEKGKLFLKLKSEKSGNFYALWIHEPTDKRHEGKAVYKTKNNKYLFYKISLNTGNPYAVYLEQK